VKEETRMYVAHVVLLICCIISALISVYFMLSGIEPAHAGCKSWITQTHMYVSCTPTCTSVPITTLTCVVQELIKKLCNHSTSYGIVNS
jgi:hypothetical protein